MGKRVSAAVVGCQEGLPYEPWMPPPPMCPGSSPSESQGVLASPDAGRRVPRKCQPTEDANALVSLITSIYMSLAGCSF